MRLHVLILGGLALGAGQLPAQEIRPSGTASAVEAMVGNKVLQVRYLTEAPITQAASDLDSGLLLSENREFIGSAALMFDTTLNQVPRLSVNIGPQAYAALLSAQQKTDVFAAALGATARYELVWRLGIAAFGSGFYSPGVPTFGSAHNLYDFTVGGEIQFAPRLMGLGGYRWLKFTLVNEPDERVQNELFVGLRWRLE